MVGQAVRRFFEPQYMVKDSLKRGEMPGIREAYSRALETAGASTAEAFLIALISMMDTVMVGVLGPHAIAAVGLVTQPRFIVLTPIIALNIAVTSVCARRRGQNDEEGAARCLKQSIILSIGISTLLSVVALLFSRDILLMAGAQPDTIEMANQYFLIILLGTPAYSLSITICAAQRGIGQTRVSMRVNIVANLINICLNYLLIGGNWGFPRLGVRGAAIATVVGWGCSLVLAVLSLSHKDRFLFIFSRGGWRFDRETFSSLYRVTSGSFVEQICMRIGFVMTSVLVANLGTIMFAANQILLNILSLSFSCGEGLSIAAASLVGRSLGEKRPDLSIMYGKVCQRMAIILSVLIFLIFAFFGTSMVAIFTDEQAILDISRIIMILMGFIVFGQTSQLIFMGALRGAGDTRYTAIVSMLSIMLLRPTLTYLFAFPLAWGLVGAWFALIADQYLRLALTHVRFSSGKWLSIQL